jgi:hypothetical protein
VIGSHDVFKEKHKGGDFPLWWVFCFGYTPLLVWLNETPPILSTIIVSFSMSKNTQAKRPFYLPAQQFDPHKFYRNI